MVEYLQLWSNLTPFFHLLLMKECIKVHGAPEIVNSDQGSQYTTKDWQELLTDYGIQVSMDGRGTL